jgi:hypothetical protein
VLVIIILVGFFGKEKVKKYRHDKTIAGQLPENPHQAHLLPGTNAHTQVRTRKRPWELGSECKDLKPHKTVRMLSCSSQQQDMKAHKKLIYINIGF